MNKYLDIKPEVQEALMNGRPVVALESTIISHGMPYPQNVETALQVEQIIRDNMANITFVSGKGKGSVIEVKKSVQIDLEGDSFKAPASLGDALTDVDIDVEADADDF